MAHKILVVDDSPIVRCSIRSCIEQRTDWQVCGEAENGAIAVEKVAELNPDVVILDLQMPVMNGLEAARQITRIAPNIPLVMFTMYSSEQLFREAQAAGIKAVFSKSSGLLDRLIPTIQNILKSKNPAIPRTKIIEPTA